MNDTFKDLKEFLPWIAAIAAFVGMLLALQNNKRSDKQDTVADAKAETRIETKLDTVQRGVESIQLDFKAQQRQLSDISDRVARVEESSKSAHHRIDEMKGMKGE